jgi:general stress protein YciG
MPLLVEHINTTLEGKAMAEKGTMSVREAGRRGGRTTKARHGDGFYRAIGHKGGTTTSQRMGHEFYQRIGRKGGARVRQLIQLAKRSRKR